MFEAAGSPVNAVETPMLAALLVLPLFWALVVAISSARRRRGSQRGEESVAETASVAGSVATLGVGVALVVTLASSPKGHWLLQHVAQLARLGQLDLPLDLALVPRTAPVLLMIGVIGCASVLQSIEAARPDSDARLAWTGIVVSGASLTCIGDSLAAFFSGLGILSLGAWGLGRSRNFVASVTALAGHASVLLGFGVLFWSLGGSFGPEGYEPDGAPRFVLVTTNEPSEHPDQSTLRMTTHAGALVSSDDTDLPNEPIRAPFSVSVSPAVMTLRVQGGVAASDVVVPRVALSAGRTHVLMPVGPTASLRSLDDQLALVRGTLGEGSTTTRAMLERRSILGLRAPTVIALLLFGGALLNALALASRRGPAPLASFLEAFPGSFVALRLSELLVSSSSDGLLVAVLGALVALVLAARAATTQDAHHALRSVLASSGALAVCSAGLGDSGAALVLLCASHLGAAAIAAGLDGERDARWLGVACAGMAGLLPGVGSSAGFGFALSAALRLATIGEGARIKLVALASVVALLLTVGFGALALFGIYSKHARVPDARANEAPAAWPVLPILASATILVGGVLGAGTAPFGGGLWPLAWKLGDSVDLTLSPMRSMCSFVLTTASAALALKVARGVGRSRGESSWVRTVTRVGQIGVTWPSRLTSLAEFFSFSVVVTSRRIDAMQLRLTTKACEALVLTTSEKVRDGLVIGMVTVLLLLVLSSWTAG
jgi:hypothetical protein